MSADLCLRLIYARDLADTVICALNTNRCEPAKIDGALEILRDELDGLAQLVEQRQQTVGVTKKARS